MDQDGNKFRADVKVVLHVVPFYDQEKLAYEEVLQHKGLIMFTGNM
jgi:hypothetical protein